MSESSVGKNCVVDFAEAANRIRPGQFETDENARPQSRGKIRRPPSKRVKKHQTESDYIDEILRFRCALVNLAQNDSDPAVVIRYMDPLFGDVPLIREHLDHAVRWINRFAEEWSREQTTHGSPRQVQQGSE